jgi:hypothetical protein
MIPISLRSVLILSSHLRLDLPNHVFSIGLPINVLNALLPSLTLLGECYKLLNLSLRSLLRSPFYSLMNPNTIRLR